MNETNLIELMEREAESAPYVPANSDLRRGKAKLTRRRIGTVMTGLAAASALVVAAGVVGSGSNAPSPRPSESAVASPPSKSPTRAYEKAALRRVENLTFDTLDPQRTHIVAGNGGAMTTPNAEGTYASIWVMQEWTDGQRRGTIIVGMSSPEDTASGPDTTEDPAYYRCGRHYYTGDQVCDEKTLDDGSSVWVMRDKADPGYVLGVAYEQPAGGTAYALVDRAVRKGTGAPSANPLKSLPVTVDDLAALVQQPGLALPLPSLGSGAR